MPKSLTKDKASATETYAEFIAEPFEAGYGQIVGNSLRRVHLSSLEGAAITSIRITGHDHDYTAKHRPILLLKFDGSLPDDWPHTEQGNTLGPYCVVHESFKPSETIYGYVEQPRIPYGVVSLEFLN